MLKAPDDSLLNDMEIGFRFMTIEQYSRKLYSSSIDNVCSACLHIWSNEGNVSDLFSEKCSVATKLDRVLLETFDISSNSHFDYPLGVISVCEGIETRLEALNLNCSVCQVVKAGIRDALDVDEWQQIVNEATGSTFLPQILKFIADNQPKVFYM